MRYLNCVACFWYASGLVIHSMGSMHENSEPILKTIKNEACILTFFFFLMCVVEKEYIKS